MSMDRNGNCKQVWKTVNSPKCKRLHDADVETTSTTSTQDLQKISTTLDNMIELIGLLLLYKT